MAANVLNEGTWNQSWKKVPFQVRSGCGLLVVLLYMSANVKEMPIEDLKVFCKNPPIGGATTGPCEKLTIIPPYGQVCTIPCE